MLAGPTVTIQVAGRTVTFLLTTYDGIPTDGKYQALTENLNRWIYRCECGKFQSRKFIVVESEDDIPEGILSGMALHAAECQGKVMKATNGH